MALVIPINLAVRVAQVVQMVLLVLPLMVLVEQVAIRSQVQYKQEYLATLYSADTLYGVANLRSAASSGAALSASAFALIVPA